MNLAKTPADLSVGPGVNTAQGAAPRIDASVSAAEGAKLMGRYALNGCTQVPTELITQIAGLMPPGPKVEIVG